MIERNYNTAVLSYRLTSAANDTRVFSGTATVSTKGILLPAAAEDEALLEGSYSEVRKLICPVSDIRKGDKVVVSSVSYYVGGLKRFDNAIGSNQHLEVILYVPN